MTETDKHIPNGTNETSKVRQEHIDKILLKRDIRSSRWEYYVILNTLQNIPNSSVKDLFNEINSEYECEMISYNSLWNNVKTLQEMGVISSTNIDKLISVNPEYITSEVKYLPISNYSVALFFISIISLVSSYFLSYKTEVAIAFVVAGAFFMVGQYFGSEFKIHK